MDLFGDNFEPRRYGHSKEHSSPHRTEYLKHVLDKLAIRSDFANILDIHDGSAQLYNVEHEHVELTKRNQEQSGSELFFSTKDPKHLQSNCYDIIVHSPVLDRLYTNFSYILHHLHRALKHDGLYLLRITERDLFNLRNRIIIYDTKNTNKHLDVILKLRETFFLRDCWDANAVADLNSAENCCDAINSKAFVVSKYDYLIW